MNAFGQSIDSSDRFRDQSRPCVRLLFRLMGSLGRLSGVSRHLMHTGSHLNHRRSTLLRLLALPLRSNPSFSADIRETCRDVRQLLYPTIDSLDQPAQTSGHVTHGGQQLARLVSTMAIKLRTQIAFSNRA
ncbi:hypothetical protein D9M70_525050 [compost metagenome]